MLLGNPSNKAVYALMAFCMCTWYELIGNLVNTKSEKAMREARAEYLAVITRNIGGRFFCARTRVRIFFCTFKLSAREFPTSFRPPMNGSITVNAGEDGELLPSHALLAEDIWVKSHGSVAWVPCFEYSWSRAPNPDNRHIDAVSVCFRTGNTNQTSDRSLKYEVVRHRSAPGKNLFLDMMGQFILFARWSRPEDYLFCRETAPFFFFN